VSDPVQSILSRALPPAELARRVRELLAGPNDLAKLAALLPELLNALGVVVDGDGGPLTGELLGLVCLLAPAAPEASRRALRQALEVGWLFDAGDELAALLSELGEDVPALRARALAGVAEGEAHERQRAMALLCALRPGQEAWEALLSADAGPAAGRLETQRALLLARDEALPRLIEALSDERPEVRMRAEAALLHLGPKAAPAAEALLHMPPWPGGDERPSPVLHAIGEAAMLSIREALAGEGLAQRRAEHLLRPPPTPPVVENPIDHLAALAAGGPSERQKAFEALFRSWFDPRLPQGLRARMIEATLDRLERYEWMPRGPLSAEGATERGLRRGARALCWLCLRMEPPLVVLACRVLARARFPGPVPLLNRLLGELARHHDARIADAAEACLKEMEA
jgi:hypothetical protein